MSPSNTTNSSRPLGFPPTFEGNAMTTCNEFEDALDLLIVTSITCLKDRDLSSSVPSRSLSITAASAPHPRPPFPWSNWNCWARG